MNNFLLAPMFIILSACGTATVTAPELFIPDTKIVYEEVPEEILDCPLPPVIEPAALDSEEDYNREFVLVLYGNNVTCYESIQAVYDWNKSIQELNENNGEINSNEE